MATEPPKRPCFVYSTLADPSKYIRLLKVEADPKNTRSDRIRISVLTTYFDHALRYHAVSYAWGSSSKRQDITVHTSDGEKHLTVRKNCAYVLRQLAHFQTVEYYWVDAICINQNDRQEKGFQVNMMSRIFGQAECVLACIGIPRGDDQFLLDWLRDSSTLCSTTETQSDSNQDMDLCLQRSKQWLDGKPAAHIVQFAKALDGVAKLPYFTRIWILQELFLSRSLKIFYGLDELPLSTLLYWWQQLAPARSTQARGKLSPVLYKKLCSSGAGRGYIEDMRRSDPEFFTDKGGFRLGKAYEDLLSKCTLSMPTGFNASKNRIPLGDVLDLCEKKLCHDPRDTVYGTLAVADWHDATTLTLDGDVFEATDGVLTADYTKTPLDLAKALLPYFNDIGQMVQLLKMLKILQAKISILDDTARRWHVNPSIHVENDEHVVSMAKLSTQKRVHVVGGCVQLTREGPFSLRYLRRSDGVYAGIYNTNDSNTLLRGIANAGVQIGDWIFPTCCCYGIVIRHINAESMVYAIVGRVVCLNQPIDDDFPVTAFMFSLGVEDVMVHLMHSVVVEEEEDWSDFDQPDEALQAALNLSFCSEPFSSFAVLLNNDHLYFEEDFKVKKESEKITCRIMRDWHCRLLELRGHCRAPF